MTHESGPKNSDRTLSPAYLVWCLLAAANTPFLLFLFTTSSLYLNNAEALAYQWNVMAPFWTVAGGLFIVGLLLSLATGRFTRLPVAFLFWFYALIGPVLTLFGVFHGRFHGLFDTPWCFGAFLGTSLLASYWLARKKTGRSAVRAIGLVFLCFVALQAVTLISQQQRLRPKPAVTPPLPEHLVQGVPAKPLPNVYHILVDMFETDMFEYVRTPALEDALRGFCYFPENTTAYYCTSMSVPSTFQGRYAPFDEPQAQYQWDAYNTSKSLLYWLIRAGYVTEGLYLPHSLGIDAARYWPSLFMTGIDMIDDDYGRTESTRVFPSISRRNQELFSALWCYTFLPASTAERIGDSETVAALRDGQKIFPPHHLFACYGAFQRFLREEAGQASENRYVFMHLPFPHEPFLLTQDGVLDPQRSQTSPEEQVRGTMRMIVTLLERLKSLDRFKESMIVIHADHGISTGNIALSDPVMSKFKGRREPEGRSRALLLVKYPGEDAVAPLRTLPSETMNLDIAPTIAAAVGVTADTPFDGVAFSADTVLAPGRVRRYYSFDYQVPGKPLEWTSSMDEWAVTPGEYGKLREVRLTNNPSDWTPDTRGVNAEKLDDPEEEIAGLDVAGATADAEGTAGNTNAPFSPGVVLGDELIRNGGLEGDYSVTAQLITMAADKTPWQAAHGGGSWSDPIAPDASPAAVAAVLNNLRDSEKAPIPQCLVKGIPGQEYALFFEGNDDQRLVPLLELQAVDRSKPSPTCSFIFRGGVPDEWAVNEVGTATLWTEKDSTDFVEGATSLHLRRWAGSPTNAILVQNGLTIVKGRGYRLVFCEKMAGDAKVGVLLQRVGTGEQDVPAQTLGALDESPNWKRVVLDFVAEQDMNALAFFWPFFRQSNVSLDAVSLREIQKPPAPPTSDERVAGHE